MSLVGPQETISSTIRNTRRPKSLPISKSSGRTKEKAILDVLTDRQQEVMQTAFDMGYYEVPREVSTEEITGTLELDPSTVAEHLQRAERNVLSQLLS